MKSVITFIFLFFLSTHDLLPQTDTLIEYQLSEVVVTATKTKMPLLELASSITVIDSGEIASSKKSSAFDLLKNQNGLSFMQQGGSGMLANVFLRGGEAGHSLILIDGIEVNMTSDPDNAYDFSYLHTGNINRIEILRGPQSILYGSNALGGVINIITQTGLGAPKFSFLAEGGSYNTYNASAGFNGSYDLLSYSLTLGRSKTDGFSSASDKYGNTEKDGHSRYDASSKIGLNFPENFSMNLFYRFTDAQSDNDQFGGINGDDPTYIFNLEESSFKAEAQLELFGGIWEQTADVTYFRNIRKYNFDSTLFNLFSSNSFYDGRKLKLSWQNNLNFSKIYSAAAGVETENEEAYSEYYSSIFPPSILPLSQVRTTGVYLQNQFNLNNCFFASIGGRFDKHDLFGWAFTYRIAPAYMHWDTGTKIKATFGSGYRAPSLFNLFHPSFGNNSLEPEKSIGWDAGVDQYFTAWNINFGITYFQNYFKDMFGYDAVTLRTINTEKAFTHGLETYFNFNPFHDLNIKANYTYMQTEDRSENSPDKGKKLLRRPDHKAGLNLIYGFLSNAQADLEIMYVGKKDDMNFSVFQRLKLKDYTLFNLALSYRLFDFAELFGRIENLFDTDYEEVYGYGTPGLSVYAGTKLTL